jgi:hypothetical protein
MEIAAKGINYKHKLAFIVVFLILSVHFKFYETINLPPQSTDLWRQADCYSIALNYYQNGYKFFHPQVHFLFTQNGYAAGEFPLIYFISAILFKLFGVHYFLFKGLNLLIFFTGLYFLFKLAYRFANEVFSPLIICVLYFCTPVIFFYANNFLSDVSALSFNIIGFYYFIGFIDTSKNKKLISAALCFALAGLLKASASILVVAILSAIIFELIFNKGISKYNHLIFKEKFKLITSFGFSLMLIIAWYVYAIHFNKSNKTVFFGTKAMKGWPLWENNFNEILETINNFSSIHVELLSSVNICLFIFCILMITLFRKKIDPVFLKIWMFLFLGLIMFVVYFWKGFQDQQYYLVNLIILPLLSVLLSLNSIKECSKFEKLKAYIFTIVFVSTLYVIYTGKNMYKCYYKGGWRHQKLPEVYYEKNIEEKLSAFGITKSSKIISIDDGTPNGTLAMLNRRGWSSYGFDKNKNFKNEEFDAKITMGASFLILNDTNFLKNIVIKNYTQKPIGNYKNLYCYQLK